MFTYLLYITSVFFTTSITTPPAPSSSCKYLLTSTQSNLGPLSAVINPCYPCLTLRSSFTHASRLNLHPPSTQGNHLPSMIAHIFCLQITDALVIFCRYHPSKVSRLAATSFALLR
ncbi:uncharacterized protein F5891DRAFT_993646 [Suillus fuscotomentosus]|uniref:Secreted protein n=1 Tax=Suillus fuscotomentosus TaxID=1912939 RepID=A0AAD4ELY7_9AGAM|nr:uncharacterized protein F5891DRAFT_993646 [Suillus fuscotomentosus]KAG1908540.1 hypothetical protein F5891DRAFT_993646 [Suillus fuscotomentosus]